MNIYKQIRAFYGLVFNCELDLSPNHISLYLFLINQNNRSNWTKWFKCPFDTAMMGACIHSNKTYYKVLNQLKEFKLIKYEKGKNHYKAPKIHIIKLYKDTDIATIPAPENDFSSVLITLLSTQLPTQVSTQLGTLLTTLLSTHKDILLTNNYKLEIKEKNDFKKSSAPSYKTKKLVDIENYKNETYLKSTLAFQELIIKNLKEVGASTKKTENAKGIWIDSIRLLIEKDGETLENLRKVFKFLQGNSDDSIFWKKQILSTANLRKHFDKLIMNVNGKTRQNNKEATSPEQLIGIFKKHGLVNE